MRSRTATVYEPLELIHPITAFLDADARATGRRKSELSLQPVELCSQVVGDADLRELLEVLDRPILILDGEHVAVLLDELFGTLPPGPELAVAGRG